LAPSSWSWTLVTPTLSAAAAVTVVVPETVALAAGALIVTVGACVSVGAAPPSFTIFATEGTPSPVTRNSM
jgi:hypothetical protein